VNRGCISKKLFHRAALLGEAMHTVSNFGWSDEDKDLKETLKMNWAVLRENIGKHVRSLNQGYITGLKEAKVQYANAYATFKDKYTVELTNPTAPTKTATARRFIVATGGRPRYPDIPGAKEHCITSDEIFALDKSPGHTLIVGARYIALETAGFLRGLGLEVTVLIRSKPLRGFDKDMANMIVRNLEAQGVQFKHRFIPTRVEPLEGGGKRVFMKPHRPLTDKPSKEGKKEECCEEHMDVDTVMLAIGRVPNTCEIGLEKVGVLTDKKSCKILVYNERTTIPHIYALGDVMHGGLELTPVASKSGILLAKRLYGEGTEQMNYALVPTTVFTPVEYGSIGFTEEDAIEAFGEEHIEVFHSAFTPLEETLTHSKMDYYCKIICNYLDNGRVIGFHYLGPNAGEVTQGFAAGMKMGMHKEEWDTVVGIHPCCAEELVTLRRTKRSGIDPVKTGC
jgi:thioredoxin reductase (NADPH)